MISSNVYAEDFWEEIQIVKYENDLSLTSEISSIAINNDGTVAIRSASKERTGGPILSVYSKKGEFLYGYWVDLGNERGFPRLYFNAQNELCYYSTSALGKGALKRILITFHPERGTYTPQLVKDESVVLNDNYQFMNRNIYICVRNDSDYLLYKHSNSHVSIRNKNDNTIYKPVDYSQEYSEIEKIRNRDRILCFIGCTAFMVLACMLLSKMDENRMNQGMVPRFK